uniref:Tyr recombinase domain-containing protein n=1 Tax=Xenopus tropicalis TaxID=8364 RepID=A0A803JAC4_XENTR
MHPTPDITRLVNKPPKEHPDPTTGHALPGNDSGHSPTTHFPTTGKDIKDPVTYRSDSTATDHCIHDTAAIRTDGRILRCSTLRKVSHETNAEGVSEIMEQRPQGPVSKNSPIQSGSHQPSMVVPTIQPSSGQTVAPTGPRSDLNRCEPERLGSNLEAPNLSGPLVFTGKEATYKCPGNSGHLQSDHLLVSRPTTVSHQNTDGQQHSSSLPQQARRYTKHCGHAGDFPHHPMGRSQSDPHISHIHPRSPELAGGLPEPEYARPRGMAPPDNGVSQPNRQVGHPISGRHGVQTERTTTTLLLQDQGPKGRSCRRLGYSLVFSNGVCIPTNTNDPETPQQSPPGRSPHNPDSTEMAESHLVCGHNDNVSGPSHTTAITRPTYTGSSLVSRPPQTTFDGISLETDIWKQKGFHPSVITTLLAARRPSTNRAYYRVWRIFLSWCTSNNLNWKSCTSPHILQFLQNGFDMNLSITSLKVQTSALAALFHKQWAMIPEVRLFFQALQRIKPPIRDPTPSWDLNLVLAHLQHKPFEPLESTNLKDLTLKTVFLMAIASARRVSELAALSSKFPWLKFHQDKAVLRTNPSFIPKMATTFHLNQEIVIPVLKVDHRDNESNTTSTLDPVRALKEYIHRTQSLRQSDSLFLLFGGPRAGFPASKRSIARWLVLLISEAYNKAGRPTPMTIRAHATRKVSTSWALYHEASLETICQAATWSSPHTFTKFYKFDVFNSAPAEFGRKVLQSTKAPT